MYKTLQYNNFTTKRSKFANYVGFFADKLVFFAMFLHLEIRDFLLFYI